MLETLDPGTLKYYEVLKAIHATNLWQEWQEETQEQWYQMLECVPPIRMKGHAFMVGECATHTQDGAIYDAHIEIDGKYFWRPALLQSFNPANYRAEVRVKFYGQCFSCGHPLDLNGMCTTPLQGDD